MFEKAFVMYIILVKCRVLFELTEKMAVEVELPNLYSTPPKYDYV